MAVRMLFTAHIAFIIPFKFILVKTLLNSNHRCQNRSFNLRQPFRVCRPSYCAPSFVALHALVINAHVPMPAIWSIFPAALLHLIALAVHEFAFYLLCTCSGPHGQLVKQSCRFYAICCQITLAKMALPRFELTGTPVPNQTSSRLSRGLSS